MGLRRWIQKRFRTDLKKLEEQECSRAERERAQQERDKDKAEARLKPPPMWL